MKFHKEITGINAVYDVEIADELFGTRRFCYRQLSLMKQENIRIVGTKKKVQLSSLQYAIDHFCGYCFNFRVGGECEKCPLFKRNKKDCADSVEYTKMRDSKTKKEFLEHHETWCKWLGLWQKGWK